MDSVRRKLDEWRTRLAHWLLPPPRHRVDDDWVEVDLHPAIEDELRLRCFLAHDARLRVFSSERMDRHLAAARAGFTIPPYKLRVTEFPSGAKMFDYSAVAAHDRDEEWPPKNEDPLKGVAEDFGFLKGRE